MKSRKHPQTRFVQAVLGALEYADMEPVAESIYFITQMTVPFHIKVGWAKDVKKRLRTLQISNPFELRLISSFKGDRITERVLHMALEPYHVRGEWFRGPLEIMTLARQLNGDRAGVDMIVINALKDAGLWNTRLAEWLGHWRDNRQSQNLSRI